ncbi:MAG: molybdopterin-dependent oxidoreductase [Caldilineaceae bacterium]|nr:molybdopterin-dependent oxidoreductase [Caldilineaceae bacterium]
MSKKNFLTETLDRSILNRRSFMKWSGALGGTAVLAKGGMAWGLETVHGQSTDVADMASAAGEEIFWNSCNVNCGSRCLLQLHVKDGRVVRVETDDTGDDAYGHQQIRACLRGRSIRKRIYHPDRLKYPMKRTGKRGSGEFEQISWEEAYDTIASEMQRVKAEYGNEAFYINYATGTLGGTIAKSWPPESSPIARLMNLFGGYLNHYGTYSTAQIRRALPYTYGSAYAVNSLDDIANSKLVVLFGSNLMSTRMSGGGLVYDLQEGIRRGGAKVIVIDPRHSDTAANVADEWIANRPGTDAALVAGMAYVMITEDMVDQPFLDKYCVGYDEEHMPEGIPANNSYKSYILGQGEDQTPKTPEWAARITGVPAATIVRLAREIAQSKPAHITMGWGSQRQANGEQNCRAIPMLAILTGNVGIHGGNTGAHPGGYSIPSATFPTLENPVKASISVFMWTDAIERGAEMTALADGVQGKDKLDVPIKFFWNYAGNTLINQHSDVNRTKALLEDESKCEMTVVIDNYMTPSAKFADILLPDLTNWEQDDLVPSGNSARQSYYIFASKAIEPMFECRSVYEMCSEIARRLDLYDEFTEGRTQEEWLRHIYEPVRESNPDYPDFDSFREMGIYKKENPGEPIVAFQSFREDPEANPLATETGKIEIFSKALYEIGHTWELPEGDVITGLPIYAPTWDGLDDPLKETYPLQMIGHHYKQRTHSTYGNIDWLQEVAPQTVWINSIDAAERGIEHGDRVRVFNDRGATVLPAKVTSRIMPGVIDVPQGSWYQPDADGVDQNGCVNVLTSWRPSPLAKGNPQHTNLVQVEKA